MLTGIETIAALKGPIADLLREHPYESYTPEQVVLLMMRAGIVGLKLGATMMHSQIQADLAIARVKQI